MGDMIHDNLHSGSEESGFSSIQSNDPEFACASVIFHSTLDSYSSDSDIDCVYELGKDFAPHVNDYIGLFSVGSQGPSECVVRVPCAVESLAGAKTCEVIFQSKSLPKGNLRYYQFIYKTENHETCGASSTFKLGHDVTAFSIEHDFEEIGYCTCNLDKSEYENRIHVLDEEKKELEDRVAHFESEIFRNRRKLENLSEENHALRNALDESKRLWFAVEGCSRLTLQGLENVRKIENKLSASIEELVSYNTQVKLHASGYRAVIKQMEEKWSVFRKKNNDDDSYLKEFTVGMPSKSVSGSTLVSLKYVNVDNHLASSDNSSAVDPSHRPKEETCTSLQSSSSAGIPSPLNYVLGDVIPSESEDDALTAGAPCTSSLDSVP